jgi:hypothetical protein
MTMPKVSHVKVKMFRLVKISGIQTSTLKKQGCTFITDFIRQFATDYWISILKGCHIYNQEQQKKNDAEGIALPAKMFRLVKISAIQTSAINKKQCAIYLADHGVAPRLFFHQLQ